MNPLLDIPFIYGSTCTIGACISLVIDLEGIALWKAAKKNNKYWFAAILVINTVGILRYCVYISIF